MSGHIATVLGARPQFIKAAAVSPALRSAGLSETLIHTGQHYDEGLSSIFFEELDLAEPAHHLGIGSAPHGAQTGRMLEAIEPVLIATRPDAVLVYGDTNSTLAGALAAAKLHIPVAHVEAGLRSFNRTMPEEINRLMTDHIASVLFAPTATAVTNLEQEGIDPDTIHQVGDVMYDVARHMAQRATTRSTIVDDLAVVPKGYILATVHRAENTDDLARLRIIEESIAAVASPQRPVVWPVHPRTRPLLKIEEGPSLHLIEPVGYLDMVCLESSAAVIVTDSGGVQKEAFFHGVPCVTLRDETEWVELIDLGWNRLAPPTDVAIVVEAIESAIVSGGGSPAEPYGAGNAAEAIAAILTSLV